MNIYDNTLKSYGGCISYKTDERNITHYSINDNRISYSYYGIYYANSFQDEWAINHLPKTGPHECLDCLYHGTYKGIFVEYCVNCSKNEYKGTRVTENVDKNNLSLFHVLHILKKDEMIDSEIIDMINDRYDALMNVDEEFNDSDTDTDSNVEQEDKPIVLNYEEINQYVDPRDKYQFEEEYYGYCADSTSTTYGSNYDGGYDSH
uniref:Uncharacterized protein n=1 Tax=viral metagenome TaxID=1070528 RepID=A0A6C0H8U3_9ZZZZ